MPFFNLTFGAKTLERAGGFNFQLSALATGKQWTVQFFPG
jgi:hypothetical protein